MSTSDGPDAMLDELHAGQTVYIPGATGEILALADALANDPARAKDVRFLSCLVPGMNETLDYAGLAAGSRVTTFMLPRCMRPSLHACRVSLLPLTYWGAARYLGKSSPDVAFAHVSEPDDKGQCSLGIASDFAPLVWPRARRRVLVINSAMPRLPGALSLPLDQADRVIACDSALVEETPAPDSETSDAIAARVAGLIPDRAHLQTGIGGAPGAIWKHLTSHRGLVLRSGLVNGWLRDLSDAGALAAGGDHIAGIAYGPRDFYDWLAQTDLVRFAATPETHGLAGLMRLSRLHSVNGALEVDLFGQINVEWQGSALSSGVGGGPDFMRAAQASEGGRSIIALPATARGGTASRIVARLKRSSVSIARSDVDTVVTEHGVASLRGMGLDERAEALTAIAAPEFRGALWQEWEAMRASMG